MEWYQILGIVVIIGGAIGGGLFYRKWDQAVKFMKEVGEAFTVTSKALDAKGPKGRELTKEEQANMIKEWFEAIEAAIFLAPRFIKRFFGR